mmetsp:Transcript_19018/g.29160  ORF Transcript_19018/g.29160 Transcript_19018/m.29160 type:complete len:160 (-) Transcript_19018:2480-2959(-)
MSATAQSFNPTTGNLLNKGLAKQQLVGGVQNNLINKRRQLAQQTLDVEDDKASVVDNVSAGGTRYIVGLKSGTALKFYGQQSQSNLDLNDSMSQYSRGPPPPGMDNQSRIDHDNLSMHSGFNNRMQTADPNFGRIGDHSHSQADFDRQSVGDVVSAHAG